MGILNINNNRYSRFEMITWWNQSVLKSAKVLVVGCGALGNEIIKNLAMLGVGNIYLVDMDVVEESNLTRTILFREEDIYKPKAETACKRIKEINNGINIKYFNGNVFELGLGVFKEMDIILCGLDNREARLFVNQSCWKVNRPWVDGAIETLNGVARIFIPPDGVCYECTMSETDYKLLNNRKSCLLLGIEDIIEGKIPTTPTIASVIAGIQVQEAVKYLHLINLNRDILTGKEINLDLLSGKGFVFNGANNESYIIEYTKKDNCPSHYTFRNIKKIKKLFQETNLEDIYKFGEENLKKKNFSIEFNNEIVYELYDEKKNSSREFFCNFNLLKIDDINPEGKHITPPKINTFHSLPVTSDLYNKTKYKTLSGLQLPLNDILTIRSSSEEIHIEFFNKDIFQN